MNKIFCSIGLDEVFVYSNEDISVVDTGISSEMAASKIHYFANHVNIEEENM